MDINRYNSEIRNCILEIQSSRGLDSAKILHNCDRLEDYGRQMNDKALIGFACFTRGETYYLLNDMKNFYAQMIACLDPMEEIEEWGYVTMANNMLGIMSLNRGNAPFAMDYYLKAISYCQNYKLPDLEWMIHMNVASLYYNIGEYQKSLDQMEIGYHYIIAHPEMPDYYNNLITAYLGMGKNYLSLGKQNVAESYLAKIDYARLDDMNALLLDCLKARIYYSKRMDKQTDEAVAVINGKLTLDMPIMDMFDDLYDYLKMLMLRAKSDDFLVAYSVVEKLIEQTDIKNLRKKILSLKIRFYKQLGDREEYEKAAMEYFDMSELMEKENRMMVINMIGMRSSINSLVQINREVEMENELLQRKSQTDALTGIYNRAKLNTFGENAFEYAYQKRKPLAIEILDIDFFKQYNDNYGHQAGDIAIKFVADSLMKMRKFAKGGNVFCSRYGGDEFVIIYEGFSMEETQKLAENLKHIVEQENMEHKFSLASDHLTISQGICWGIPDEDARVWDYLHAADDFLYKVKKISRNSIKIGTLDEEREKSLGAKE